MIEDEPTDPLIGATVMIYGTGIGAMTNRSGQYRIDSLPPGEYKIQVSMVGLQEIDTLVVLDAGEELVLNFTLSNHARAWAIQRQHWPVIEERNVSTTLIIRVHPDSNVSSNHLQIKVQGENYFPERLTENTYSLRVPSGELSIAWQLPSIAATTCVINATTGTVDTLHLYPEKATPEAIVTGSLQGDSVLRNLPDTHDEWSAPGYSINRHAVNLFEIGQPELTEFGLVDLRCMFDNFEGEDSWKIAAVFNEKAVIVCEDEPTVVYDLGIETKEAYISPNLNYILAINAIWDHFQGEDAVRINTETGEFVRFNHPDARESRRLVYRTLITFVPYPVYLISDDGSMVSSHNGILRFYNETLDLIETLFTSEDYYQYDSELRSSDGERLALIHREDDHAQLHILDRNGNLISECPIKYGLIKADCNLEVIIACNSNSSNQGFTAYDGNTFEEILDSSSGGYQHHVRIASDGNKFIAGIGNHTFQIYETTSGHLFNQFYVEESRDISMRPIAIGNYCSTLWKLHYDYRTETGLRYARYAYLGNDGSLLWLSPIYTGNFFEDWRHSDLPGFISPSGDEFFYIAYNHIFIVSIEESNTSSNSQTSEQDVNRN
ncbi:MAG: carboxypeptidase-like regulatory domain-containing protein [Candidatus Aegiribacteria sp.]|nr:carboxypeptidase-like regulatory domain-containing protein [Candidatus Aegiribacteria sp.]